MILERYEEAREEEKLRNKPEDFSDMVAEVIRDFIYICFNTIDVNAGWLTHFVTLVEWLQNSKKRKRDKEGKKKKDFKFWRSFYLFMEEPLWILDVCEIEWIHFPENVFSFT